MGNLYKTTRKKHAAGIVLVIVMLFLAVISFLTINILNMTLLETKMNIYYQNKFQAFYQAEATLEQLEQEIIVGAIKSKAIKKISDDDICGATIYSIIAKAKYNTAISKLQSIFVQIDNNIICNPKPNIKPGRQSFLIIQ